MLDRRIDAPAANAAIAQLLLLDADDTDAEIRVIVNANGGDIGAGLALHDVLRRSRAPIATLCVGEARGVAVLVLAGGTHRRRAMTGSARVRLELGDAERSGSFRDVEAWAKELDELALRFARALAADCGRHVEEVEHDLHRGRALDAAEAVAYGIVDAVLQDSTKRSSA